MAPQRGAGLSPEQLNALIEQQVVNGRILALKSALKMMGMRGTAEHTAEQLVADAAKIEAYITKDLDGLKKKSGLVVTSVMPPPGAGFRPGD